MKIVRLIIVSCALFFALGEGLFAGEAQALVVQAQVLYQQKNYDAALQTYAQALRIDNTLSSAYQGVGNCYLGKNDKEKAIKYYRFALQTDPANSVLRNYLRRLEGGGSDLLSKGHVAYRARRYQEALGLYQSAKAVTPNDANVEQSLGNAYYALGKRQEALESYQRSLALNPKNPGLEAFVAKLKVPAGQASPTVVADSGQGRGDGDWFQPLWRSLILPGWGQAYNGQTTRGLILGGATLGLFAGEIGTYVVGSNARNEYLKATGNADYDTPYSTWENMVQLNHGFYIGMTALYVFTAVDAVFNAKTTKVAKAADKAGLNLAVTPEGFMVEKTVLEF